MLGMASAQSNLSSVLLLLVSVTVSDTVNPLEGGMATRLFSQREELLQTGLSYLPGDPSMSGGVSLQSVHNLTAASSEVNN